MANKLKEMFLGHNIIKVQILYKGVKEIDLVDLDHHREEQLEVRVEEDNLV